VSTPPVSTGRPAAFRRIAPKLLVFVVVVAGVFTLAELHLARPGLPKAVAGQNVVLGDFYNGQTLFGQKCAACHGTDGKGGPVGPKLVGLPIALAVAKAQIDAGGGAMPPGLVTGRREADVLAFLATILGKTSS
jgi:mono/diheme cytochrome c family protein